MSYPCGFPAKDIVLFVNRANYSEDSLVEVLTFAIGLVGGLSEHRLDVVFVGDGVTECVSSRLNDTTKPYLTSAKSRGVAFWADKYSLEYGLFAGCAVISPEDLADLVKKSDMHLRL